MKNQKGMEMALGTVVTVVILLIVLIVIGSYFLGGVTKSGEKVEQISDELVEGDEEGKGGVSDIVGGLRGLVSGFKRDKS
jgi:hypothetical protein